MRIPKHIAIIPDGNRRWALSHGLRKQDGYEYGLKPGIETLRLAKKYGIPEITFYGFTTDNTHRPTQQVTAFRAACLQAFNAMRQEGCQLLVLGNTKSDMFPPELLPYTTERRQEGEGKIRLNFLINYGWEWDLGEMNTHAPSRQNIIQNLHSKDVSTIDLIIRWGGRTRLSGLLPVQSVYADFYSIDSMWPDFTAADFENALTWYQEQDVTRGG